MQACQKDWKEQGDRCYLWSDEKSSWKDAEAFCKKKGGHLASVTSEQVHVYIADEKENGGQENLWIGGSDGEEEGTWRWNDGSPWSFTNWYIDQPNNRADQNCLRYIGDTNKWDDAPCNREHHFVCSQTLGSGVGTFAPHAMQKISRVYILGCCAQTEVNATETENEVENSGKLNFKLNQV